MKREGRQHGMVRSIQILPSSLTPNSGRKYVSELDSPPTAGVFTKVSRKPTNHSKFTGKSGLPRCGCCHDRPVCKSKEKAKGRQKVRLNDVLSNHRLFSWRVVNSDRPGFDYSEVSATGILDHLGDCGSDYHDDEVVEEIGSDLIVKKDVDDEDEGWCLVTD